MDNKWTDQRVQRSLELIKSELMIAINYKYNCKEFLVFAQEDKIGLVAQHQWKNTYRLGIINIKICEFLFYIVTCTIYTM